MSDIVLSADVMAGESKVSDMLAPGAYTLYLHRDTAKGEVRRHSYRVRLMEERASKSCA